MSLISPNFDVKWIIFPNFGQGVFPKIAGKSPVLGQVWYLIVLIPDLCLFSYFDSIEPDEMLQIA